MRRILSRTCLIRVDSCWLVPDSCWFVLAGVGLVLTGVRLVLTRVDSCWLMLVLVYWNRLDLFKYTLPRFNIYFSWKYNRDSVDFKETPPGKIVLNRCVELVAFFTGETSFLVGYSLTIPRKSTQIQKPTKY